MLHSTTPATRLSVVIAAALALGCSAAMASESAGLVKPMATKHAQGKGAVHDARGAAAPGARGAADAQP
ncbi:MAG: hypothetical protein HUU30_08740, partial [Burkholderiaceae bacterium]|nr:hypothetical protein [Burkholderiaceae bacterium]